MTRFPNWIITSRDIISLKKELDGRKGVIHSNYLHIVNRKKTHLSHSLSICYSLMEILSFKYLNINCHHNTFSLPKANFT